MVKVASYNSIISDAQAIDPRIHFDKEVNLIFLNISQTLKLISISTISKSESRLLHLVCVSSKGDRFYFSTCNDDIADEVVLKFVKKANQFKSHSKMSLSTSTV
jgi:hypothetical protein